MELLTTGRWLTGQEAVEWGLALRSVPADQLDEELEKLVAPLRTKSRTGLGWIKSVTQAGRHLPIRDGVALESSAFVQYFTTSPHPRQGIQPSRKNASPSSDPQILPFRAFPPSISMPFPQGAVIYSGMVREYLSSIAASDMPRGDQD